MFDDLVDEYKRMDINQKRDKLVSEIKIMIAVLEKICIDKNIKYRQVKSKEILDLKKENVSEDDYLEALYVYLEYLKEVIGCYFYNQVD